MSFILLILAVLLCLWLFFRYRDWVLVEKQFELGNVCVVGLRGKGKDVLFDCILNSNRYRRYSRNGRYISNVNYTDNEEVKDKGVRHVPFKYEYIGLGGNTFKNFSGNTVMPYDYPFEDGVDYFLSDCGVYFPAQECNTLNKLYPSAPLFVALSRQVGDCNVHCNIQNLNRLWDKFREQSDCYIRVVACHVFFGKIAYIKGYIYDDYDACNRRVKPMHKRWGRLGNIEYDKFTAAYGDIRKFKIIKRMRGTFDTRIFKYKLANGVS